jgi:hypothetical protein
MKKACLLVLLVIIPFVYAMDADVAPVVDEQTSVINYEDSPIDLAPVRPLPAASGRALGDTLMTIDALALGINGPSGLSWDGQYLYVASLLMDSVFVVDPFVPSIVNRWPTDPLASSPYGCALEQNLWVTHINPDTAREYTLSGTITGNAFGTEPCNALYCADGAEWWANGEVWFIGVGSACGNQAFKFSIPAGTVLDSIGDPLWTGSSQRGLSYDPFNQKFWLGGWNSDSVWELNLDGSPTGRSFYMDGCAGIAYDWQSTYHPTPVLWITRQAADQIVMVDADNPNPGPNEVTWDFETGLQDWTHTNGMAYPAGWDVQASGTHASQTPPSADAWCMWVDSDAGGSAFWIQDTAMSPVCTPQSSMDWMVYGFSNYGGSGSYLNELRVGIKYEASGVWTAVELTYYPSGTQSGPAWDSVDVSAYATDDHVQPYFYFDDLNTWGYWAAFDNVSIAATPYVADHDVGCSEVVSPPEGSMPSGNYDVIGRIQNFGKNAETFDAVAHVYDTVGMVLLFDQSVTLTSFPVGGDSNVNFGSLAFDPDKYFYTEIYTMLSGDSDPSNDTSSVYSWTAMGMGDVIFELDAQGVVNDNQLLGIEFDGERFYITGGGNAADPNKVYVVDTAGTLLWTCDQPSHSTGWGWRDIAWDDVYVGPDRIDTLYASVNANVDKFSIDLTGGILTYHGFSPGAQNPNRALAYKPDSGWFYCANFSSSCYKFNKSGVILQSVANTLAMYGAAYDGDAAVPTVWWHSQDDPGTGFACQITEMDAMAMTFGSYFGFERPAALTDAIAGGLCYYHDFRGMDVLFALLQGTPNDYIVGIFLRPAVGIEGKPGAVMPVAFGFAPTLATVSRGRLPISYSTTVPAHVSLKVYDGMGRLVQTLVNAQQPAGEKSVYWDSKDLNKRTVANGVYFLKLQAEGETAVHKLILVR